MTRDEIAAIMRHGPEEMRLAVRWQYLRTIPPGFFDLLLQAIAHADPENRRLLQLPYPEAVEAVERWQHEDGFSDQIRARARELLAAEAQVTP